MTVWRHGAFVASGVRIWDDPVSFPTVGDVRRFGVAPVK